MSMPTTTMGSGDNTINAIQDKVKAGLNELVDMKENTMITLITFLTFFVIIISFLYYFYYNGTGSVGGISIILIITVMISIVGQALMGRVGAFAGGIIGAFIGIGIYITMAKGKDTRNCDLMNGVYGEKNTNITNTRDNVYSLYDYYIKTAYNCCSGGDYRNDYVSLCSLNNLLKQGVRGLDFEIYSVNDEPVVATSTVDNYCVKETFNFVKFSDVLNTVISNAFSNNVPNPKDPIIFHLRIKSENKNMYKKFSQLFSSNSNYFLNQGYSFEYKDNSNNVQNFGKTKLSDLMGKIIVIVDRSNPTCLCEDCDECGEFYEYVNMTSNSTFMQILRYNDIQYTQTPDDLIDYNKTRMTIGMPDKGPNPVNPSSAVMREMGCQMLAMRYQTVDSNVEENDMFFNEAGHAFVLKPANQRAIITIIDPPPVQDPALYYDDRTLKTEIYDLKV
jgi:hypothetical protein